MKNRSDKKVGLIVHACDRYEFLYRGFELFFNLNWDTSIPTVHYFATEEKNVNVNGFQNILSGKGEWSDRLFHLLKHDVKEDYVLYFQEDMWLTKKVNPEFFKQLFDHALSNDIDCVKLHSSEVYKTIPTSVEINGLSLCKLDNKKSKFLMSHQVTLWKKTFLMNQLKKGEHPWRNEREATKRLKKLNPEIYHVDYFSENGKQEINTNQNSSIRSEYFTVSVNGMFGENVTRPLQLLQSLQIDTNYLAQLTYRYENQITHDGKPKPRKETVFQQLKKRLKAKIKKV